MTRPRRRSSLALLLLLGSGCSSSRDQRASARSEIIVTSLLAAEERADTAALEELFWPDATYDDYSSQLQYRGIAEIVGYATSVHSWADDVYLNAGRVHAGAGGAVAEWLFTGVQARPMGDLVPQATGREVVLNGVTVVEIEGGRIRRAADYTDTALLMLQLGGRIELPGGRVIEGDSPR